MLLLLPISTVKNDGLNNDEQSQNKVKQSGPVEISKDLNIYGHF